MSVRSRYRDEPLVEGSPVLAVLDEDREAIADILAELLVGSLEQSEDGPS